MRCKESCKFISLLCLTLTTDRVTASEGSYDEPLVESRSRIRAKHAFSTAHCRSNTTHISWKTTTTTTTTNAVDVSTGVSTTRNLAPDERGECEWQTYRQAEEDAYRYLLLHVMEFDRPFLGTLGFQSGEDLPDGLSDGLVGKTIEYALRAKVQFPYTDDLPRHVWQEYVLNYANTNEPRNNWRPVLWLRLESLVTTYHVADIPSAVRVINENMWTILSPNDQKPIYFESGSTPLIMDTMSILVFGYASCTGVSILFVNALRTLGVPARVVGTPAWNQDAQNGNHNWVEVWWEGNWYFLEGAPAAGRAEGLDVPPCEHWFCGSKQFTQNEDNTTLIYAARLSPQHSTFYPLAWEPSGESVPGEDVSWYYQQQCQECN